MLTLCLKFLNRHKLDLRDYLLVFLYLFRFAKHHMYNAKVNTTDFGRIVVDQTNRAGVKFTFNGKLFVYLSLNSISKCLHINSKSKKRIVFIIDMSTNTDRPFCNQTLFTCLLATNIVKDTFPISDHNIRNNLLEGWIGFSKGTGHKTIIFFIENRWQITINISAETLKNSKLLEERTRKNENIFTCNSHNDLRILEPEFGSQNLGV